MDHRRLFFRKGIKKAAIGCGSSSHGPLRKNGIVRRAAMLLLILIFPTDLALVGVSKVFSGENNGFARVTGPCNLVFPADHGMHPDYRTEWWYYTGNLETGEGRPFGFQLTVFRRQISPPEARKKWPSQPSEWRSQQIYLGHTALTDISGNRHLSAEEVARGALQMAGVMQTDEETNIFLKRWRIHIGPEGHRLSAKTEAFELDLFMVPLKPIVKHGDKGYSRKGDSEDRASCYYSFTRLKTIGRLTIDDRAYEVSGLGWMDHEFSTAALQEDLVGWDWFSLQLDSGEDLMIYVLRQSDGRPHPSSSGTVVGPSGESRHLTAKDFRVKELAQWQSPHSNGRYPARWQLDVPSEKMTLSIVPNMADQEMRTPGSTGVTYWEGSVSVSGQIDGVRVNGAGYVELTGYAHVLKELR